MAGERSARWLVVARSLSAERAGGLRSIRRLTNSVCPSDYGATYLGLEDFWPIAQEQRRRRGHGALLTPLVDDVQSFSMANGGITGSVQSRVVRETASGTLDFYWQVTVDPSSTAGSVASFRLSDFGYNDITDGDYRVDSTGTISPFIARVFNPADRPTGAINFLFTDPPVRAGAESKLFFLRTTATSYAQTAKYDLTSSPDSLGISPSFSTFAPAVPEPTALTLVLGGLGYLLARGRRRS